MLKRGSFTTTWPVKMPIDFAESKNGLVGINFGRDRFLGALGSSARRFLGRIFLRRRLFGGALAGEAFQTAARRSRRQRRGRGTLAADDASISAKQRMAPAAQAFSFALHSSAARDLLRDHHFHIADPASLSRVSVSNCIVSPAISKSDALDGGPLLRS